MHLSALLTFPALAVACWGARSPINDASARTMARAGMVEEGRIREHVRKGGVWRDSVVHAMLDREWAAQQG
ncbi:GNAT family N-acetyltransferase [Streptomyces sp. PR69]|uniref:GNAT family N-acetyltransferase n=1 Tax=Streptomyces sp. PR69 TaxID=2984950 RepID=UPI003A5C15A8